MVSLLVKSILGCVLPQILYAHVIAVGKVVERLGAPLCLENSDFNSYVLKPSSCLKKNSAGEFILLSTHEYY